MRILAAIIALTVMVAAGHWLIRTHGHDIIYAHCGHFWRYCNGK